MKKGDYSSAFNLFERALKIQENFKGINDLESVHPIYSIGVIYHKNGDIKLGKEYY